MGDCALLEDYITVVLSYIDYRIGVSGNFKDHIALSQISKGVSSKMMFGHISGGVGGGPVWQT